MEIPSCGKNNAGCCILPEHSSKDEYQKCDKCAPRDHKFVSVLNLTKQKQYPFFRQSRGPFRIDLLGPVAGLIVLI